MPGENDPFYCILCETTHSRTEPRIKCPSCARLFCVDSINEMIKTGYTKCPYCPEELKSFNFPSIFEVKSNTHTISNSNYSKSGKFSKDFEEATSEPQDQGLNNEVFPESTKPIKTDLKYKMRIQVTRTFVPQFVPASIRTEIMSTLVIKSIGSTELMYLQIHDELPTSFKAPTRDQVEILKGNVHLKAFEFKITDGEIWITLNHLENSPLGSLKHNEEIIVKYPIYAFVKSVETFMIKINVAGNIYPKVCNITALAQTGPITVIP